eukprot:TRINITY_DN8117_c0_g1_i6.p1 TRINITY_DN8117_c0_g1~~TRINITY_DN8117_c0_g1_i6.p1  ORF type:complete len:131 (+),score=21.57 TRINITY_DN8117_c0_g1_i6:43-435(+)
MGHRMCRMCGFQRVAPGGNDAGNDQQTSASWAGAIPAPSNIEVLGAAPGVVQEDQPGHDTVNIERALETPSSHAAGHLRSVTCEFWGGSWYRTLGACPGEWTRWRTADEVERDKDGGADEENPEEPQNHT